MTDREKAIVMAYTGTCMLAGDKLGIYYQYIQEKLGHCVMTHELVYPEVQDAIREATKDDFIELCRANDEPRVMTLEEVEEGQAYWLEMRGIASEYAICKMNDHGDSAFLDFTVQHGDKTLESAGYGQRFRCWTSRPTDAQREAIPWA